ncbi:MAG: hypothetical protein EA406_03400 [Rhodospirillales bacterium]|nr:MAG: hypothetical protein EA406_03400 [Rhodospirillales bacterium]
MKGHATPARRVIAGAVAGLAMLAGAFTTVPANAESCVGPEEQRALNTRALQSKLMVAALSCRNQAQYNAFVERYRSELQQEGQALRQMFHRRHGGGGESRLNALVTRLANESSQQSLGQRAGFCQQASLIFAEALNGEAPPLATLLARAEYVQELHGYRPCGADPRVAGFGGEAGKGTLADQQLNGSR